MLEIERVCKSYEWPGQNGRLEVLRDISFKVGAGASVAVVGPSGSGKSTLLNMIGALDRPTSGRVVLDGQDLAGLNDVELARVRNHKIGFVFQLHHLLPQCTVLENVLVPTLADRGRAGSPEVQERAMELLERMGLDDWLLHRPGELSGGQLQRVAVVRALINRPKLLLADEPTGSLDGKSADKIADLLVELNRSEGVAMIVVTHSAGLAGRMGRVMELSEGQLRSRGA
jgi:ABC-type lipoprotein export system ATPase subunit